MAEFVPYSIRAANDTSDAGPALGTVCDELCIAWTGGDNRRLNIMPVRVGPDGTMAFDTDRKQIRSDIGIGGPALAQAEVRGQIVMAWTLGNTEVNSILGVALDRQFTTIREMAHTDWTEHSPAMALWIKEVNLAWTGSGNKQLNVAPLVFDESGWTFSPERKFTSTETSEYEPALAWRPAPNRLYLAWTGQDGALNVMHCAGGSWSDPQPHQAVFHPSTKHTFTTESSGAGPALVISGGALLLSYRGSGNRNLNLLRVNLADYSIVSKHTSRHTTAYRPAITSHQGSTYVAWTGEDGHLNLGRVTNGCSAPARRRG